MNLLLKFNEDHIKIIKDEIILKITNCVNSMFEKTLSSIQLFKTSKIQAINQYDKISRKKDILGLIANPDILFGD